MNVYSNGINPNLVQQLQNRKLSANNVTPVSNNSAVAQQVSFESVLKNAVSSTTESPLEFSKHAMLRLSDRNISLSANQMERIEKGVDQARNKGVNDSLVLVDDVALIVNVKNNIVVTAVGESQDKIFTNIDGAIIV